MRIPRRNRIMKKKMFEKFLHHDNDGGNSNGVKVVALNRLTDDRNIEVTLEIWNFTCGQSVMVALPRTKLRAKSLQELIESNGGICSNAKQTYVSVSDAIDKMLKDGTGASSLKIGEKHSSIGWTVDVVNSQFKCTEILTRTGSIPSVYDGTYNIKKTGCLAAFKRLFTRWLKDNIPMQGVLCMAAVATVLPYARRFWDVAFYNPINHLAGTSSKGKTTALHLFTSFGTCPEGVGSMLMSFLGTDNAILMEIGENHGYPVAIDELSTTEGKKWWTAFIYSLADGKGKGRCAAGGAKLQKVDRFETVFLTAGEIGLLRKCKKNEGVRARLFEFADVEWTRSAEEADAIKGFARRNYGLLTPLIAKELLEDTSNCWLKRFGYWRKRIKDRIVKDKLIIGIADRITDVVALYMVSCEILAKVAGVEMAVKDVFEFFFFHIILKNAEDANMGERAYEVLVRHFSRYRDRFLDVRQAPAPYYYLAEDQEGLVMESSKGHRVGEKTYNLYIVFYPEVAENILSRQGFTDPVLALKAIQKEKLLKQKDDKRVWIDVKINDVTTKVCGVWVEDFL